MRMCWPTSRTRATTTPAMASSVCAGRPCAVTAWDKLQLVRAACRKKMRRGKGSPSPRSVPPQPRPKIVFTSSRNVSAVNGFSSNAQRPPGVSLSASCSSTNPQPTRLQHRLDGHRWSAPTSLCAPCSGPRLERSMERFSFAASVIASAAPLLPKQRTHYIAGCGERPAAPGRRPPPATPSSRRCRSCKRKHPAVFSEGLSALPATPASLRGGTDSIMTPQPTPGDHPRHHSYRQTNPKKGQRDKRFSKIKSGRSEIDGYMQGYVNGPHIITN